MINPEIIEFANERIKHDIREQEKQLDIEITRIKSEMSIQGVLMSSMTIQRVQEACICAVNDRVDLVWNTLFRGITATSLKYDSDVEQELRIFVENFFPEGMNSLNSRVTQIAQQCGMTNQGIIKLDEVLNARHNALIKLFSEIKLFVMGLKNVPAVQVNVIGDDSPVLSQKFGILRADPQLGSDFSAYESDAGGLGLLFFDIDHFKALNTKFTETVVDQSILVPFQHLLIEATQSRGFVYSVGGDEFIILLRNVNPDETYIFAERLLDFIRKYKFNVNGEEVMITLSVGMACCPSDAKTHGELRKLANVAENKAKNNGRDRIVCASSSNITFNTDPESSSQDQTTLPSIKGKHSTVFFSERFGNAFPGVRGIKWFKNPNEAVERLRLLFKEPFFFCDSNPIWWWRTGDMHINDFSVIASDTVIIDHQELIIDELAAVNDGAYYQSFVYIKTKPSKPSGVYADSRIQDQVDHWGYAREEFALFHEIPITRAEYDDGSAVMGGKVVDLNGEAILRIKYLTPYNLIIAPFKSPINNKVFDRMRVDLLNGMLKGESTIEELNLAVLALPKKGY